MIFNRLLRREPPRRIEETGKGVGVAYRDSTGENRPKEAIDDAEEKVRVRGVSVLDTSSFLSPNASLRVFGSVLAFLL